MNSYLKQARALPESVDASDRSRLEEDTQVCNFWHTYSYYRKNKTMVNED